jgi:predicted metal-binding protein
LQIWKLQKVTNMNNQKIIVQVHPVIDYSVRRLCYKPYHNHPNGCPNYGKKEGCPPGAEFYHNVYDLSEPVYAICNAFDIKSHIDNMRELHPKWSEYQLRCCLYWQTGARRHLGIHIKEFYREYGTLYHAETCPEAMGVDLVSTMAKVGIKLIFPPTEIAYQIALAAIRK